MAYEWKNKVVLITGAASGIGARVVKLLSEEGVKYVAILDIAVDSGKKLQDELNEKYKENKVKFIKCDVTNEEQLFGAFRTVIDENGYLDVVINNAGIMNDSLKTYKKEIDINVTALVTGTLKALEIMRKDENGRGGTVINISSVAGLCQAPQLPIYWATKSAVIQFSNCIGLEEYYSRTGVRVLTVCFGVTDTALLEGKNMDSFDEDIGKALKNTPIPHKQSAESAARGVIEVFKSGESGSTWLVANDQPAEEITHTVIRNLHSRLAPRLAARLASRRIARRASLVFTLAW